MSSIGAVYQIVDYKHKCPWCAGPAKPTGKVDGKLVQMMCEKSQCNGKNKWWA